MTAVAIADQQCEHMYTTATKVLWPESATQVIDIIKYTFMIQSFLNELEHDGSNTTYWRRERLASQTVGVISTKNNIRTYEQYQQ